METHVQQCIGKALLGLTLSFGLLAQANAQPHVEMEWARQMGGSDWNAGTRVAADGLGNVYSTGTFQGTADFTLGTGTPFTNSGYRDIYISKVDAQGHFIWARQIGNGGTNQGMGIRADDMGNVYITGQFTGSPDFSAWSGTPHVLTATGGGDAFVMKLNPNGDFVWAKNVGSVLPSGQKIAYDLYLRGGYVYITGEANSDIFVSKLDTAGNFSWTKTFGGDRADYSYAITVDDSGNVYTTGQWGSNIIDFDPGPQSFNVSNSQQGSSSYHYEGFIEKLDSAGNFVWAVPLQGTSCNGFGVAVDKAGNVYATGLYRSVDFNPKGAPHVMNPTQGTGGYICKYTSGGHLIWAEQMEGQYLVNPRQLAIDGQAQLYICGWFNGTGWADLDPGTDPADTFIVQGKGSNDIFITSLDSSGKFQWARAFGGSGADYGYSISVDKNRSVYSTGYFGADADFDTTHFINMGSQDVYLLKINQFCSDSSSSTLEIAVCEDSFRLNDETYFKSGTYQQVWTKASGCDSTINLFLTINGKMQHPVINVNVLELGTQIPYSTYQWLLNGNAIAGATSSTYTVTQDGDYAVVVSNDEGCIDTSDIYRVNSVGSGIEDTRALAKAIHIYPNPAHDFIHIDAPLPVRVQIVSIEGRTIEQAGDFKTDREVSLKQLAPGMYLIQLYDEQGRLLKVEKLVHH